MEIKNDAYVQVRSLLELERLSEAIEHARQTLIPCDPVRFNILNRDLWRIFVQLQTEIRLARAILTEDNADLCMAALDISQIYDSPRAEEIIQRLLAGSDMSGDELGKLAMSFSNTINQKLTAATAIFEIRETLCRLDRETKNLDAPTAPIRIFFCHNSKDKDQVRRVVARFDTPEWDVWFDEKHIVPGEHIVDSIVNGLSSSQLVVVLLGKHGEGPWQRGEVRLATDHCFKRDIPIIPVLLPGGPAPDELGGFLRTHNCMDLRSGITEEDLRKLERGAKELVGRQGHQAI